MAEQTITAEKLCALTGLTDRRHRQIAKEGYFPPPIQGEYQLNATIAGMFRYYREAYQKTNRTLAEDKQTKIRREIELLELKISEQNRQLVPISEVDRVWSAATAAARQCIIASELPKREKDEIVAYFQKVNAADYYRKAPDTEGDESPPAD